ncbi:hypothetical protein AB4Y45_34985 [Paraburkholderia sp. EG287A]|uniref:hypothetical protein n=1 Tax=Paraburkholderia sp. EG287A TaxID=3237012 RepID=UPI0034D380C4
MKAKLILVHTTSGCHVLFVNKEVVMEAVSTQEIDRLVDNAARKLSAALGVPLVECTVDADPDGNWVAADLYALIPTEHKLDGGTKSEFAVRHWDTYFWDANGPIPSDDNSHKLLLDDRRADSGMARLAISALDENKQDLLDVMLEVGSNPLNKAEHSSTVHVHLHEDAQLVSLYRIGDRVMAVPNTGVRFRPSTVRIEGRQQDILWIG